jgi:nicotinamide riboside kinase
MIKTIVISGPESSGKTWLSNKLAKYYNEPIIKEYSREFLTKTKGLYKQEDLIEIAKGQYNNKLDTLKFANNFAIEDTGIIDIQVWSLVKYQNCDSPILELFTKEKNTFHLLCAPNIPYEIDSLRENPSAKKREFIFQTFYSLLNGKENFIGIIDSPKESRLKNAIDLINSKIKI